MANGWRSRNGSTRAWRRVRALVLARDGRVCRMDPECHAPATTVDHVVPLSQGGAFLDPANLRAACPAHNSSAGGALSHRPDLGTPSRTWSE